MKRASISMIGLLLLLGFSSLRLPLLQGQVKSQTQRKSSGQQQAPGEDRVRAFRGHRKTGLKVEPDMSLSQAQQLLQTKSYYASLAPRQIYVEEKGYLNFVFPGTDGNGEVNGRSGNARLQYLNAIVEIGIKPSSAGKTYLTDCLVKGVAHHCFSCDSFSITGPDANTEQWAIDESGWQHLLFTVSSDDTAWLVLKLHAGTEYTFKSCNITEVP